jgi:hypothetical protein
MTCSACAPVHERRAEHKTLPSDGERPRVAVPYTTPPVRARTAGGSIRDSCPQDDQVSPPKLALLPVVLRDRRNLCLTRIWIDLEQPVFHKRGLSDTTPASIRRSYAPET